MSELFGDDFISIEDDDGVEYDLEVLGRVAKNDTEYLIVTRADPETDEEAIEVAILKVTVENGEEIFLSVDEDEESDEIYAQFLEENKDDYIDD